MRSLNVFDCKRSSTLIHILWLASPSALNDAWKIEEGQVRNLLADDGNVENIVDHSSNIC